jgi:hypothetical protein
VPRLHLCEAPFVKGIQCGSEDAELQGHHANQTYYRLGIMSPEYKAFSVALSDKGQIQFRSGLSSFPLFEA